MLVRNKHSSLKSLLQKIGLSGLAALSLVSSQIQTSTPFHDDLVAIVREHSSVLPSQNSQYALINIGSALEEPHNQLHGQFRQNKVSTPANQQMPDNYVEVPVAELMQYINLPRHGNTYYPIWWYDRESKIWMNYHPELPKLNTLSVIRDNESYAIAQDEDTQLTGIDPSNHKPTITKLRKGWNLVKGYEIINPQLANKYGIDRDGDKLSDWFELNFTKTSPLVPNERYAIVMNTWEDIVVDADREVADIKKFLVLNFGWKPENITALQFKDASYTNFENAVKDIANKATPNDFVYIMWISHAGPGYMSSDIGYVYFQYNWVSQLYSDNAFKTLYEIKSYEEIDRLVDQIKPKVLVLMHTGSYDGRMLEWFKEGPSPRVIYTRGFGIFAGSMYTRLGFWDRNMKRNEGQLSLEQFLHDTLSIVNKPYSDKGNLASKLYLGEVNPFIRLQEFNSANID